MDLFNHRADGYIRILNDFGDEYLDTLENFLLDLNETYQGLPAGYVDRIYVPIECHLLGNGTGQEQGEQPWEPGNHYIELLSELLQRQYNREHQPPAPPEKTPDEIKREKIRVLNADYTAYNMQLQNYYVAALMDGDTQTQQDILDERAAVLADYQAQLAAINNGQA